METLFETPRLVIIYDADNCWLHLLWRGRHNEDDSKTCILEVLAKVRETRVAKILNDSLLDQDGWGELTHWLATDFMRQLAEAGVVAAAWVLPENLQARADVQTVLAQVSCPLIDTFIDPEAAYDWLRNGAVIANPDC